MTDHEELEEKTKDELRDIARDNDLQVSGTKAELIERIDDDSPADNGQSTKRLSLADAMQRGAHQFRALTGLTPELVASATPDRSSWTLSIQAVEVARIPSTADIVGLWEVRLDADGEVVGFERTERGTRSAVGR